MTYRAKPKKAYSLGIAKTDIDLMVYFAGRYKLEEMWKHISKAKTTREIRGIWTGSSFIELERGVFLPDSPYNHGEEKRRIYVTHDFLRAIHFPLAEPYKVLYLLKNLPVKFDGTENHGIDVLVNENIDLKNILKIYIYATPKEKIEILKKTKQKYPHIEILFFSKDIFYGLKLKYVISHVGQSVEIGYPYESSMEFKLQHIIEDLVKEKRIVSDKLKQIKHKIPKEEANAYRLFLEGVDIDIDFLTKLQKNIGLFKKFYTTNKSSFDKLRLVFNTLDDKETAFLEGKQISFKTFRKQWDDWFPNLEHYDYSKNTSYIDADTDPLSRQISEQINRIDGQFYENKTHEKIDKNQKIGKYTMSNEERVSFLVELIFLVGSLVEEKDNYARYLTITTLNTMVPRLQKDRYHLLVHAIEPLIDMISSGQEYMYLDSLSLLEYIAKGVPDKYAGHLAPAIRPLIGLRGSGNKKLSAQVNKTLKAVNKRTSLEEVDNAIGENLGEEKPSLLKRLFKKRKALFGSGRKNKSEKEEQYSPEELERLENITSPDEKKRQKALTEDLNTHGNIAFSGGDSTTPEKLITNDTKQKATKELLYNNIDNERKTDALNVLNNIAHRKEVSEDTIHQEGHRKLKYSYKTIENNCIQFDFTYADNGKFAGKIVAYKPYLKYFGYSPYNFVGERGKEFLEEMCDIRYKNPRFAGKTTKSMICEWLGKDIRAKSLPIPIKINPVTGGFRRLTFMHPVEINGRKYCPNIKFPGQLSYKKKVYETDFYKGIEQIEKHNGRFFPPIMIVDLPQGEYTFYGKKEKYDGYSKGNPSFIFFFMPDGKRVLDITTKGRVLNHIRVEDINRISRETKIGFDAIVERIVKEPFIFLARCHASGFCFSDSSGTDAHYGNFFLSTNGEIYSVSDFGHEYHSNNSRKIKYYMKQDINYLIGRRKIYLPFYRGEGLCAVIRYLNIPKEEIEQKYIPMASEAYLETLERVGATELIDAYRGGDIFQEKGVLLSGDEEGIIDRYHKEDRIRAHGKICTSLEENLEKVNLDDETKTQWIKYYQDKIFNKSFFSLLNPFSNKSIKSEIIERFRNNGFSENNLPKKYKMELAKSREFKELIGRPKGSPAVDFLHGKVEDIPFLIKALKHKDEQVVGRVASMLNSIAIDISEEEYGKIIPAIDPLLECIDSNKSNLTITVYCLGTINYISQKIPKDKIYKILHIIEPLIELLKSQNSIRKSDVARIIGLLAKKIQKDKYDKIIPAIKPLISTRQDQDYFGEADVSLRIIAKNIPEDKFNAFAPAIEPLIYLFNERLGVVATGKLKEVYEKNPWRYKKAFDDLQSKIPLHEKESMRYYGDDLGEKKSPLFNTRKALFGFGRNKDSTIHEKPRIATEKSNAISEKPKYKNPFKIIKDIANIPITRGTKNVYDTIDKLPDDEYLANHDSEILRSKNTEEVIGPLFDTLGRREKIKLHPGAFRVLASMGERVSDQLIHAWKHDPNPLLRRNCFVTLELMAKINPYGICRTIPSLIEASKDKNDKISKLAVYLIKKTGKRGMKEIKNLLRKKKVEMSDVLSLLDKMGYSSREIDKFQKEVERKGIFSRIGAVFSGSRKAMVGLPVSKKTNNTLLSNELRDKFGLELDELNLSNQQIIELTEELKKYDSLDQTSLFNVGVCPECGSKSITKGHSEFTCNKCGLTIERMEEPNQFNTPVSKGKEGELIRPEKLIGEALSSNDIRWLAHKAHKDPVVAANIYNIAELVAGGMSISRAINTIKEKLSEEDIERCKTIDKGVLKENILKFQKEAYKELEKSLSGRLSNHEFMSKITSYLKNAKLNLSPKNIRWMVSYRDCEKTIKSITELRKHIRNDFGMKMDDDKCCSLIKYLVYDKISDEDLFVAAMNSRNCRVVDEKSYSVALGKILGRTISEEDMGVATGELRKRYRLHNPTPDWSNTNPYYSSNLTIIEDKMMKGQSISQMKNQHDEFDDLEYSNQKKLFDKIKYCSLKYWSLTDSQIEELVKKYPDKYENIIKRCPLVEKYAKTKGLALPQIYIFLIARSHDNYQYIIDLYIIIKKYAHKKKVELTESNVYIMLVRYTRRYMEKIDSIVDLRTKIREKFGILINDDACFRITETNTKWKEAQDEWLAKKVVLNLRAIIVDARQFSNASVFLLGQKVSEFDVKIVMQLLERNKISPTYKNIVAKLREESKYDWIADTHMPLDKNTPDSNSVNEYDLAETEFENPGKSELYVKIKAYAWHKGVNLSDKNILFIIKKPNKYKEAIDRCLKAKEYAEDNNLELSETIRINLGTHTNYRNEIDKIVKLKKKIRVDCGIEFNDDSYFSIRCMFRSSLDKPEQLLVKIIGNISLSITNPKKFLEVAGKILRRDVSGYDTEQVRYLLLHQNERELPRKETSSDVSGVLEKNKSAELPDIFENTNKNEDIESLNSFINPKSSYKKPDEKKVELNKPVQKENLWTKIKERANNTRKASVHIPFIPNNQKSKYAKILAMLKKGKLNEFTEEDMPYLVYAIRNEKDKDIVSATISSIVPLVYRVPTNQLDKIRPMINPLIELFGEEKDEINRRDICCTISNISRRMNIYNYSLFDAQQIQELMEIAKKETKPDIKKRLIETIKSINTDKSNLINTVYENEITVELKEDLAFVEEATSLVKEVEKIKRGRRFLKGDFAALRFRAINQLKQRIAKEIIIMKLTEYSALIRSYYKYLPSMGVEIEIWEHLEDKLDKLLAKKVCNLFGIVDQPDKLIEYSPDPSENFVNQVIIVRKLKQYGLIPSQEYYPLHVNLGITDKDFSKKEYDALFLAYPMQILYTSNDRLDRGIISGTKKVAICNGKNRIEFRLFDITNALDNTGTIEPDGETNFIHLMRDFEWLGAMLKAKYNKNTDSISITLKKYFDDVYVPEIKKIFTGIEFSDQDKNRKELLNLRKTTNIQQSCKDFIDETRSHVKKIILEQIREEKAGVKNYSSQQKIPYSNNNIAPPKEAEVTGAKLKFILENIEKTSWTIEKLKKAIKEEGRGAS